MNILEWMPGGKPVMWKSTTAREVAARRFPRCRVRSWEKPPISLRSDAYYVQVLTVEGADGEFVATLCEIPE